MLQCHVCHETIMLGDSFCKHCGAKQNVEENWQQYYSETLDPQVNNCLKKYETQSWFFLLWKNENGPKVYSNLSDHGNRLLILELEKNRYSAEMQYASAKTYEKKKHSYDIRIRKIAELIALFEKISKTQNFLSQGS